MSGCSGHGAAPSGQPQAIGRVAPDELTHGAYQFDSRATPAGTSQPLRLSPSILRHLGYWTTDAPRFPAHTWARTPTGLHESRGDSVLVEGRRTHINRKYSKILRKDVSFELGGLATPE